MDRFLAVNGCVVTEEQSPEVAKACEPQQIHLGGFDAQAFESLVDHGTGIFRSASMRYISLFPSSRQDLVPFAQLVLVVFRQRFIVPIDGDRDDLIPGHNAVDHILVR